MRENSTQIMSKLFWPILRYLQEERIDVRKAWYNALSPSGLNLSGLRLTLPGDSTPWVMEHPSLSMEKRGPLEVKVYRQGGEQYGVWFFDSAWTYLPEPQGGLLALPLTSGTIKGMFESMWGSDVKRYPVEEVESEESTEANIEGGYDD